MDSMEKKFQQFQSESRPPTPRTRVALWIRLAAVLALGAAGFLLYRLPGGFPPPTWLRLVALVRSHQLTPGPALFITSGQSLALLLAWALLVPLALHVVRLWRFDPRELLAQPPQAVLHTARAEEMPTGPRLSADAALTAGGTTANLRQDALQVNTEVKEASPPGAAGGASLHTQVTRNIPKAGAPGLDRPALLTLITATTEHTCGGSTQLPLDGSPARIPFWWPQEQHGGMSLVVSGACQAAGAQESRAGRAASLFSAAGLSPKSVAQEDPASLQPYGLFVLSDGIAYRQAAGGDGSTSLETVQGVAQALLPLLGGNPATQEAEAVGRRMLDGILHANATLFRRLAQAQIGEIERAVGTTLAVLLVLGTSAYVASVGNSRVYLFRTSEGLVQVTYDHAPGAGQDATGSHDEGTAQHADEQPVQAGLDDEVQDSPARHARLYRSLGEQEQVEPDLFALKLAVGDLLLLCSEGLWSAVEQSTLDETLRRAAAAQDEGAKAACWALCQQVLAGGGAAPLGLIVAQAVALRDWASSQGEAELAQREGAVSSR